VHLNLEPAPVCVHILRCRYVAHCGARGCLSRATTIARKMDAAGRFVRQIELCDEHALIVTERERARGLEVRQWPA
jgi:hypothetical protein